jgi:tetratricopeptide (TPR) repeat protein
MAKGDYAGAIRECEKSSAPAGLIAPLKARSLLRLGRFTEAEAAYDSAAAHSADLRVHLEFGNFLLTQKDKSEKAAAIFQSVLKKYPNEQVATMGLATLALKAKDFAEARKRAEFVLTLKNPTPLIHVLLGQINLSEGKPQAAVESFDKALAAIPGYEKALFLQAISYNLLGKLDKADEILTALIPKQAKDPEQLIATKRALLAIKTKEKKFPEALKLADELDPLKKSIDLNRSRVEIYALSGNLTKAEETLSQIKASMAESDLLFYQSWIKELGGDVLGAAGILEADIASKKNSVRWALLRMKAGKYDGILEKLPKDSMKVADWMRLASMADHNKQFALSAQFYKNVVSLDKENAAALNNYAYASMQTSGFDRKEILEAAKKAYLSLSDKPEVLQTYAEALIKCDKPADCIKLLQDKTMLTKQSANLLYQLGTAYEKTGDLRGAVSSYRMALGFPESTPDWPSDVDRGELTKKMEGLKAEISR